VKVSSGEGAPLPSRPMEGYLKKQSPKLGHELQRRYFRLEGQMLKYFKDERDREPKGVIPLSALKQLSVKGTSLELDVGYRKYLLVASDEKSVTNWKAALQAAQAASRTQALPAWAAADPFDEDDEPTDRPSSAVHRGARGKGAKPASSVSNGSNPFCSMVGTTSEYAQHGDVKHDDPNASLEQIEGAIAYHEKGIESSLARTLRTAEQTKNLGAETLHKLHEQGEQMDRIANDSAKVKANLDTSDQILRTMGSLRGAFINMVTGQYDKGDAKNKRGGHGGAAASTSSASMAEKHHHASMSTTAHVEPIAEGNEPIDQISRLMTDLKQQAVDMGTTLKGHSTQLDSLTSMTEDNSDHMARNTRKARALAGGTPTDPQQFLERPASSDPKRSARKQMLEEMRKKHG